MSSRALPSELWRIVCENCDNASLFQLQLTSRVHRVVVGEMLWRMVRVDGSRGIVTFSKLSDPVAKPLKKFHDAIVDGLLSIACGWIRIVMISTPDDSIEANSPDAVAMINEHAREAQALMTELIPQYFTTMERIEIRSSCVYPTEDGVDWPMVVSTMCDQIPDVTKYLSLDCHITKSKPLSLINVQILTLSTRKTFLHQLIGSQFPSSLTKLELTIPNETIDAEWFQYATTNCHSLRILHMNCAISNPTGIDYIPQSVVELSQPKETPVHDQPVINSHIQTLRAHDLDQGQGRILYNIIYPHMSRLHLKVSPPRVYNNRPNERLFQCCRNVTTLHVNGATLQYLSGILHGFPNVEILIVEYVVLHMQRDSRGVQNSYNAAEIKQEMNSFASALGQCKKLTSFYLNRPELGRYDDIMSGIRSIRAQCPHLKDIYLGSARPQECSPEDGWRIVEDKMFATICQGVNPDLTFQTYKLD